MNQTMKLQERRVTTRRIIKETYISENIFGLGEITQKCYLFIKKAN